MNVQHSSPEVKSEICTYFSGWEDWVARKDRWHWVLWDTLTGEKIIESPQDYPSQEECEFAIEMFQGDGTLPQGEYIWRGTRHREQRPFPPNNYGLLQRREVIKDA